MLWIIVLILVLGATLGAFLYLWSRFRRFGIVRKISGDSKWLSRLIGAVPLILFGFFSVFDAINTIIVMLHLAIFWLVGDLISMILRRIFKRGESSAEKISENNAEGAAQTASAGEILGNNAVTALERNTAESEIEGASAGGTPDNITKGAEETAAHGNKTKSSRFRPYWTGIFVLIFTAAYLIYGYLNVNHVRETTYRVETEKSIGVPSFRIALIADSHLGTTLDGERFAREMERIQKTSPDILVIAGDFVDDGTLTEDMVRACEALGEMKTTYGVYYVFGNHDKGYFHSRSFDEQDLRVELQKNHVTILEDEVVEIGDGILLAGRQDASEESRKTAAEVLEGQDKQKYIIMLDHQPNDYGAEEKAGADLVLSGHTHGGQMIPITFVGELLGVNDSTYGRKNRGNSVFIVTSGISDWAIKFKTGTISEYVLIDVTGEEY